MRAAGRARRAAPGRWCRRARRRRRIGRHGHPGDRGPGGDPARRAGDPPPCRRARSDGVGRHLQARGGRAAIEAGAASSTTCPASCIRTRWPLRAEWRGARRDHTRTPPKVKRTDPALYGDVAADVSTFLAERVAVAPERGVGEEQLILDPGPDFAKTPRQTVDALRDLPHLHERFARPLLLAISRKDFIARSPVAAPADRGAGTLAALGWCADAGRTWCGSTTSLPPATTSRCAPHSAARRRSRRNSCSTQHCGGSRRATDVARLRYC